MSSNCSICTAIPWFELQPEDVFATAHHPSRKALETSAKRCVLCRMVLQAAVSSYKDTRGIRNGRGYWRQFDGVLYQDVDNTVRNVSYVKELGSCMPVTSTDFRKGPTGGPAVVAPTGAPNPEGEHVEEKIPRLEGLDLNEPPEDMPVWVYGNFWAENEGKAGGDTSNLRLMGIGARFAKSASHFDVFGGSRDQIKLCGSSIGLCTGDDSTFARFIPGRLPSQDTSADIALNRLTKWLADCSSTHPLCSPPPLNPPLPTRVLDVFATSRGVALVQTKSPPTPTRGRYLALSHCWGTSSRLMLTRASLPDLLAGIAISYLPATFQDAIRIARRLNIKYLWIDCLCIIQDSPADWAVEAAAMASVYRNAYLTISASASTDSYTGCFPTRSGSYITPAARSLGYNDRRDISLFSTSMTSISYEHTSRPGTLSTLYFLSPPPATDTDTGNSAEWLPGSSFHSPQRTQIGSFGRRYDPIASEPLSARGWTLQERLLSPRIIHYASDQLYYECDTYLVSEDGFTFDSGDVFFNLKRLLLTQQIGFFDHGVPASSGLSFIVGRKTGSKGMRWRGGWVQLVEEYSRRRLTKEEDKLVAVQGVVGVL
ncbi:heterokaryon incompatibility protein-domain-containing protein, partial [Bombardia bombarda]